MKVTSKSIHFNYKEQCEFNYKLNIKNYPEYKKLCGVIEGLALAEREMLDWIEQHSLK